MADEYDDTGTITKLGKNQCSVSVRIHGKKQILYFSREIFYAFGCKCEGDLTNILEVGMEVDLCYTLSASGNMAFVVVAWLGDKPDVTLPAAEKHSAVYDQRGRIVEIIDDARCLAVGDTEPFRVLINKSVVYKDGSPANKLLSLDERITFDAEPSYPDLPSGAQYEATCAWTGKDPSLISRFGINREPTESEDEGYPKASNVYGRVVVIPNETLALVEVEDWPGKIVVFRNSFQRRCERVQDRVKVGEKLGMRIRRGKALSGKELWFAVKAWEDGHENQAGSLEGIFNGVDDDQGFDADDDRVMVDNNFEDSVSFDSSDYGSDNQRAPRVDEEFLERAKRAVVKPNFVETWNPWDSSLRWGNSSGRERAGGAFESDSKSSAVPSKAVRENSSDVSSDEINNNVERVSGVFENGGGIRNNIDRGNNTADSNPDTRTYVCVQGDLSRLRGKTASKKGPTASTGFPPHLINPAATPFYCPANFGNSLVPFHPGMNTGNFAVPHGFPANIINPAELMRFAASFSNPALFNQYLAGLEYCAALFGYLAALGHHAVLHGFQAGFGSFAAQHGFPASSGNFNFPFHFPIHSGNPPPLPHFPINSGNPGVPSSYPVFPANPAPLPSYPVNFGNSAVPQHYPAYVGNLTLPQACPVPVQPSNQVVPYNDPGNQMHFTESCNLPANSSPEISQNSSASPGLGLKKKPPPPNKGLPVQCGVSSAKPLGYPVQSSKQVLPHNGPGNQMHIKESCNLPANSSPEISQNSSASPGLRLKKKPLPKNKGLPVQCSGSSTKPLGYPVQSSNQVLPHNGSGNQMHFKESCNLPANSSPEISQNSSASPGLGLKKKLLPTNKGLPVQCGGSSAKPLGYPVQSSKQVVPYNGPGNQNNFTGSCNLPAKSSPKFSQNSLAPPVLGLDENPPPPNNGLPVQHGVNSALPHGCPVQSSNQVLPIDGPANEINFTESCNLPSNSYPEISQNSSAPPVFGLDKNLAAPPNNCLPVQFGGNSAMPNGCPVQSSNQVLPNNGPASEINFTESCDLPAKISPEVSQNSSAPPVLGLDKNLPPLNNGVPVKLVGNSALPPGCPVQSSNQVLPNDWPANQINFTESCDLPANRSLEISRISTALPGWELDKNLPAPHDCLPELSEENPEVFSTNPGFPEVLIANPLDDLLLPYSNRCIEAGQTANSKQPQFCANSSYLYTVPALSGFLKKANSNNFAVISFRTVKIGVQQCDVYVWGRRCSDSLYDKILNSGKVLVRFEAILTVYPYPADTFEGTKPTHDATCVWIGRKPTLDQVALNLPPPDMSLLDRKGEFFFGVVEKFYLPKMALVKVEPENTTVCLHAHAFGTKRNNLFKCSSGQDSITDFVKWKDSVVFRIRNKEMWGINLDAIDVSVTTKAKLRALSSLSEKAELYGTDANEGAGDERYSETESRKTTTSSTKASDSVKNDEDLLNFEDELDENLITELSCADSSSRTNPLQMSAVNPDNSIQPTGTGVKSAASILESALFGKLRERKTGPDIVCAGSVDRVPADESDSSIETMFKHFSTKTNTKLYHAETGSKAETSIENKRSTVCNKIIRKSRAARDTGVSRMETNGKHRDQSLKVSKHVSRIETRSKTRRPFSPESSPPKTRPVRKSGSEKENSSKCVHASILNAELLLENDMTSLARAVTGSSKYMKAEILSKAIADSSEMQPRLVNFSGTIVVKCAGSGIRYGVKHRIGLSSCERSMYSNLVHSKLYEGHNGLEIRFDALGLRGPLRSSVDFVVKTIYLGCKPKGIDMIAPVLARPEIPPFLCDGPYRGVITSIPLHDLAIATVRETPVIIPIEALRLYFNYDDPKSSKLLSMNSFLKLDDEVIISEIKTSTYHPKLKYNNETVGLDEFRQICYYYRAVSCWRVGPGREIETIQEYRWSDKWLYGEYRRKAVAKRRCDLGGYTVEFVTSNFNGVTLNLDLSGSKFYLDGKFVNPDTMEDLENVEISFHVAHHSDPHTVLNRLSAFYVKWAWLGSEPPVFDLLKDELAVPVDVLESGMDYLAVLEDFPLPSVAIWMIGVVPVVLAFPDKKFSYKFRSQARKKRRTRGIIRIRQDFYKGSNFVVAINYKDSEDFYDDGDIMIHCKGVVTGLPRPTGKLIPFGTDIEVHFQLCYVVPPKEMPAGKTERFVWFQFLRCAIRLGTIVHFSAAKEKSRKGSTEPGKYRAYEVWIAEP